MEIIEIKNKSIEGGGEALDLYEARSIRAEISSNAKEYKSEATVVVQTYNQLEQVKRCVSSILEYTKDVDYDLLLIDNGSESKEILDFFKEIEHPKKTILHIENNIGAGFPNEVISLNRVSDFVAFVPCDLILTSNWLSNLLKVMKSDKKIGMVNPVCSNVTSYQCVEIEYDSYEEMQAKAALYNVSDPTKWQECIKLVTLGIVIRKECIYAIGWPVNDAGFWHDFMDDDMAFRIRRAGYKVVIARDTWICHDHPMDSRDPVKNRISFDSGRRNFKQKYRDIDACLDASNFVRDILNKHIKAVNTEKPKILGIDIKCGVPILDIKNMIRRFGIFDAELSAYTRQEKYTVDLKTICEGSVICDREEYLTRKLLFNEYDYIVIGDAINGYYEPINVLMDAYMLLKQGGQLFFSLKNTNNIYALLQMLGYTVTLQDEYYYNYPMNSIFRDIKKMGINISYVAMEQLANVERDILETGCKIMNEYCVISDKNEMFTRLTADKIWFCIEK